VIRRYLIIAIAVLGIGIALLVSRHGRRTHTQPPTLTAAQLTDFTSLEPIDAHTHIFKSSAAFIETLERWHMHVLDILYVDDTDSYLAALDKQRDDALRFVESNADRAQLCTTFDPFRFKDADFSKKTVPSLNRDFARGAVAAKVWKNVGMEIVDPAGKYIMPDDPRFEEIYSDIASHKKTLIIHFADPDEAWGVPSPWGFISKYYDANPQWNMTTKPGAPKKKDILEATDRVLVRHPDLRVVAAHFGSLEDHLDELASQLDRYPNLAVDTAARVRRLVFQPRDLVRAFMQTYQDRILYGTDLHVFPTKPEDSSPQTWEKQYTLDWRYFATGDTFEYQGHQTQGLNLPREVLKKLYHDNAIRWVPGLLTSCTRRQTK
jgi:predicted TIM-barrel fold metal-dependent hydrolase